MATSSMLKASGLHTFNSYLSAIPEGALFVAENVNIDRAGVVEPRRGIGQYSNLPSTAKQLLVYKDKLFTHYADRLAFIVNGIYTDVKENSSSLVEASFIEAAANLRIKTVEANGNLYVTTSAGVLRFSSNRDLTDYDVSRAGGVKATGLQAYTDYSIQDGFLRKFSKVAYRVTWGKIDKNENFIEGAPSSSIEVTNVAEVACNTNVIIEVPNEVDTTYFFRIYRTDVFSSTDFEGISELVVSDELKLVYEQGHDGRTTPYTINDIATTPFRDSQVPLYTNEFSGEGILQSNDVPPFALDVALYSNHTFYANTRQKHNTLITLLGSERFTSFGAVEDKISIVSIIYDGIGDKTTITLSANHGLIAGNEIVLFYLDPGITSELLIVESVTPTTLVFDGDLGVGLVDAPTIHASSLSITKTGSPAQKYFFVGRKEVQDFQFEGYEKFPDYDNAVSYVIGDKVTYSSNTYVAIAPTTGNLPTDITFWSPTPSITREVKYPHKSYFTLYSAENLIKYVVWFYTDSTKLITDTPNVDNAVFIRVNLTTEDTRTADQVARTVANTIINSTFDFDVTINTNTLRIFTSKSGFATNATKTGSPSVSLTHIQEGYGEDTSFGYARLPKYVSAGLNVFDAATSLTRCINSNPNEKVNAYYLFEPRGLGGKIQLESKVLDEVTFIVNSSRAEVRDSFNPVLDNVNSTNEKRANRLYFSKQSQPDAVPLVNFIDVGPRDEAILRIVALRDSMFIFKEKSIYRLAGDNPANFLLVLHDNSAALITSDALSVLNNSIFALTTQGVCQISDTGLSVVSRPIEDKVTRITAPRFRSIQHTIFAASYEQDRAFFLWVPKEETDDYARECFRYNVFTNTWTTWDVNATSAVVVPAENVLYKSAGDLPLIEKERKELTRLDYADRQYTTEIIPDALVRANENIIKMSSVSNIQKGDTLVQTQYVTISQVERLIAKLKTDPMVTALPDPSVYNFTLNVGDNLPTFLIALETQLLADGFIAGPTITFPADFESLQVAYNQLIAKMNAGSLSFTTYQTSTGSKSFELIVEDRFPATQEIKVLAVTPLLEGDIELFKSIRSEVIYAPIAFGEPALMKHVRAGTMMFANANLAFGNLTYSTDLSPAYEGMDFTLEGDGSWGIFFYSSTSWGGEGTQRPFRTLIPRQKQRCRFIRPRFVHNTAFYKYLLYGVSFDFEPTNSRGYK
jgi:hypothetical protein